MTINTSAEVAMAIIYPEAIGERQVRRWPASTETSKGLLFFCHGFGLHTEKFVDIFPMLNGLGYDVISFDAVGHGDSEVPVNYDTIEQLAAASQAIYSQFAHERPILVGIGTYGGFTMRRIIDGLAPDEWVPPAVFYSVEYVNVPMWLLSFVAKRPGLMRFLDRFKASYDYEALTWDAEDNRRYIEDDPRSTVHFAVGMSLLLAYETNAFFERTDKPSPVTFIIGNQDTISHLPPLYRIADSQPDTRLYVVEGGHMHLHRDHPDVQAQFREKMAEALMFLRAHQPTTG